MTNMHDEFWPRFCLGFIFKFLAVLYSLSSPADAGVFRARARVCVQQVQVVKQQAVYYPPAQVMFLVAPPSYYGAPEYGRQPPAQAQQQKADYDVEASDTKLATAIGQIDATVTRLVGIVEGMDARLDRLEGKPVDPISDPPPAPEPDQADPTAGLPRDAVRIIQEQCRFCHGGTDPKGGFALSTLWRDRGKISEAIQKVTDRHMPVDGSGEPVNLPEEERAQLLSALAQIQGALR